MNIQIRCLVSFTLVVPCIAMLIDLKTNYDTLIEVV